MGTNVSVNGGAPVHYSGVIGPAGSNSGTTETISALSDSLGTAVLLFAQTGSVGEGSPIIDDVAISQTPLPATWLMLLSGLLGLGFFTYRGTKNSAPLAQPNQNDLDRITERPPLAVFLILRQCLLAATELAGTLLR